MKTINTKIINALYRCFQIGFALHILAVGFNFYNHFSRGFMITSQVKVSTGNFRDRVNFDTIVRQEPQSKAMITQSNEAHAAMLFDKMYPDAMGIALISVLQSLIWLSFTYLLMLIFKSLKKNDIFENSNIIRLRLIALIVGASPLLHLAKNILFAEVWKEQVSLKRHYVNFQYDYSLLSGCLYMILILVLVEILRYGMSIKSENDLTV